MNYLYLIAGAALLILGRKMFWLFAGLIGFLFGMSVAPQILPGQSQTVILAVALITGALGAALAVMVQKIAIGIVGFIAGAYLMYVLLPLIGLNLGSFLWLAVIVGAIIGAVLASSMFDWAIILLSSAVGASIITSRLPLPQPLPLVLLTALFVVGVVIQGNIKSKD